MEIQDKYTWELYGQGSYLLKTIATEDCGEIRRIVDYPLKDDNQWRFTEITEDKDGYEDTDGWNLTDKEQEEIKNYIRNVLKPSDLYEESEENKMENMKILNVAVPTDLADEVMSIISRYEGVPVDKECSDDVNQSEIISLKEQNEKLQENFDDAKNVIQTILKELNGYDKDIFRPVFEACFDEESAKKYGVEEYIEQQKYKVSKVTAIQKREIEVLVLEKDDDYSNAEGILKDMNSDEVENLFDNTMDIEYRYEEGNTVDCDMTKEQVRNRYSSEELIIADDCQDVF